MKRLACLALCAFSLAAQTPEPFEFNAIVAAAPIMPSSKVEPRQLIIMQATVGTRSYFLLNLVVTFANGTSTAFTAEFQRRGVPLPPPALTAEPLYGLVTVDGKSAVASIRPYLDLRVTTKPTTLNVITLGAMAAGPLRSNAEPMIASSGDNFARFFKGWNPPQGTRSLSDYARAIVAERH